MIKPWKPKRTWQDVIHDYGTEITDIKTDETNAYLTIKLDYTTMPEETSYDDLEIIMTKLSEIPRFAGNVTIISREEF